MPGTHVRQVTTTDGSAVDEAINANTQEFDPKNRFGQTYTVLLYLCVALFASLMEAADRRTTER